MALITKASTAVVRYIMIVDSADGTPETGITVTDLDMQYTRDLTAAAAKVDAIVGTGGLTTHVDNKIVEVDSTSSPGLYMVCWPDAAFATGVDTVQLVISGTGFTPAVEEIQLTDVDFFDANQIADALLKRDWNSVSGEAARSVLNALRLLRNKSSITGVTLTVTKENDSTAAWTGTVTTDATADPITAVDPA